MPAEAKDEWRYRLAIAQALSGERDAAVEPFNQIIQQPSVARSNWIKPAQDFLDAYTAGQDLYRACVLTTFCQPSEASEVVDRRSLGRSGYCSLSCPMPVSCSLPRVITISTAMAKAKDG